VLHELIRIAGLRLYEESIVAGDPDPEMFKLRGEAARAVGACRDVATVGEALDSPHRTVRLWDREPNTVHLGIGLQSAFPRRGMGRRGLLAGEVGRRWRLVIGQERQG